MVIEPVIIAHGGFSALCNPRAAAQAGWGVDQIEKLVNPTGPQQPALAELRTAVAKAADTTVACVQRRFPAVRRSGWCFWRNGSRHCARPCISSCRRSDTFHASLNDEQKARIDSGPRGCAGHAAQATSRRAYPSGVAQSHCALAGCSKCID